MYSTLIKQNSIVQLISIGIPRYTWYIYSYLYIIYTIYTYYVGRYLYDCPKLYKLLII